MPITAIQTLIFANNSSASVFCFDSLTEVAHSTAPLITHGNVALSGGSTYAALFEQWASMQCDCSDASFFPVDERMVPIDDPGSNWGMTFRLFLSKVGREHDKSHWAASREEYEALLKRNFRSWPPEFDAIFLGVGEDGHTASLFPGGEYLEDSSSIVLRTTSPKPPYDRTTLGPAVLAKAKKLIVVISGEGKGNAVQGLLRREPELPIVKVLSMRALSEVYVESRLLPLHSSCS